MLCAKIGKCADVYPLRAKKSGLHRNLTCMYGDRGCRSPYPGDFAETRGFASSVPKAKKVQKACHARHTCTDRAQTSGNVSPTAELCPPHPTFGTKVRARRDVPEGKKNHIYTYTYYMEQYEYVGCWYHRWSGWVVEAAVRYVFREDP